MPRNPVICGAVAFRSTLARSSKSARTVLAGLSVLVLAACGGTVVEPSGAGGGSSSSTGTGLTTGTGIGGSSTGTGTSTGTGIGGSSTGTQTGTSTGTGTTTSTGTGTTTSTGTGGSGPVCPGAEPMDQGPCGPVGQVCSYALDQCVCTQGGWNCSVCPAAQPQAGEACMSGGPGMGGGAVCGYGDTFCRCGGGGPQGSTWKCGMCPTPAPTQGDACDINGVQCPYVNEGITCNCTGMGTWNCTLPCPAAQPQPGDPCMGGGGMGGPQQCTYGATTCVCLQGQYFCN